MQYIVRDHDATLFEQIKELMAAAAEYINCKYGKVLTLEIRDSYRNMKEIVEPQMVLLENILKNEGITITPRPPVRLFQNSPGQVKD